MDHEKIKKWPTQTSLLTNSFRFSSFLTEFQAAILSHTTIVNVGENFKKLFMNLEIYNCMVIIYGGICMVIYEITIVISK